MPQHDPYRLSTTPTAGPGSGSARDPGGHRGPVSRRDVERTLLWAVIVLSAVTNMLASYAGTSTWVLLVCGVVSVLAAGTLVVRALRRR